MEKRIYRILCVTAITGIVLAVSLSTWVFYGFYHQQAELGVTAEFSAMAVATLPSVCLIILVVLCGCMFTASRLTRTILEPIQQLGKGLLDNPEDLPETAAYPELQPLLQNIASLHRQLEEQRQHDLSEMKKLDAMRREFSANVSHELKTPITSISGFAEMIENGMVQNPEDCRVFAGRIVKESSRLLGLVEDIIHLSRLDEEVSLLMTPCSLLEIADELVHTLWHLARQSQVSLSIEGNAPPVLGYRAMLCELLQNLCENAIKYNRPGGFVKIILGRQEDFALLRVVDNGIGIAPQHQDVIFQRFYRVDKSRSKQTGGTGLGLSIAKHITEHHHGVISVHSVLEQGSEFTVLLPLAQESGL